MPWLAPDPESGAQAFNCDTCNFTEEDKGHFNCPFTEAPRTGANLVDLKMGGIDLAEVGVCPGALQRRRGVAECASAYAAFDKGALATFAPDPDQGLLDGIMTLHSAVNVFSAEKMRKLKGN